VVEKYFAFCESLWRSWLSGDIHLHPSAERLFDMQAAPEPYPPFDKGHRPLIVLTTNPGGTMFEQLRATVLAGLGPVNQAMSYAEAARAFGAFYEQRLTNPARTRIRALKRLAELVNAEGVLQVNRTGNVGGRVN
jgi:hypothetical protein